MMIGKSVESSSMRNTFRSPLRAGAFKVEITPKDLAGLTNLWQTPFEGVHDSIFLRALIVANGNAMAAIVAVLCVLGSYAANINLNDIFLAFFFGVLGTIMSALGFPVSPLVLGLILGGDLLDVQFRRALMAGKGSIAPFFTRGVSIALILFIVVIVFYQYVLPKIRGKKEKERTVILE